ncbi:MAG: DNA repair protein RecN [Desulfuromonadales bacterium]|nr:DNA repair protein RecN [Desulfuromonadales bacterium]
MLTDLIIKNFAIIETLHVSFAEGFNVLTGETGAGKSIIIDAVNLLLGGRARGEVIRTGADEAVVEAVFDLGDEGLVREDLQELGLDQGDELLVRRIVSRSGKNRIFVNGSPVPLVQLRDLTGRLVNIYGQHEHQSLQRTETHLALLDRFAGHEQQLADYQHSFQQFQEISEQLRKLEMADRDRHQRLDMLRYQQQELKSANLVAGEQEELEQERVLLLNAERLAAASNSGYQLLYGDAGAVCETLSRVAADLGQMRHVDPALAVLAETITSAQFSLEDVAVQLRDYSAKLSFEPTRLQEVDDRLALLKSLQRKYAPTVAELIDRLAEIEDELALLDNVEGHRSELEKERDLAAERVGAHGKELSRRRWQAGERLAATVQKELADLAMPRARFETRLFPLPEPSADGLERGEFYLSANPGEEPQPLAKIASGGELSRIMLALKRSSPEGDGVHTLIFDEVDAGIGGVAATAVGDKIGRLAREMQVLCVTHLPQVAAFADQHFQVTKEERSGRTLTCLVPLQGEERVAEMARMLGGAQVTDRTLAHARELLARSRALNRSD